MVQYITEALTSIANPEKAAILSRFFQTWIGQYGAWDQFLGVQIPQIRAVVKEYGFTNWRDQDTRWGNQGTNICAPTLDDISILLDNPYHEIRMAGALSLITLYERAQRFAPLRNQKEIVDFYIQYIPKLNNWDFIDLSAPNILGDFLVKTNPDVGVRRDALLQSLAQSTNLWERRVAIVSTFAFLKKGIPEPTMAISQILLWDEHHLIHKATGWMLREMGKRCSRDILRKFLNENINKMPRTMLRYAIEHFEKEEYQKYLKM